MKAILKLLHQRRHLLFLDLEGTQFSHEMIAFGAIKATLKADGSILRTYKGLKRYVKPKGTIGGFVVRLTGITKEKLATDGVTYAQAIEDIKKYCGSNFQKMAFVTFGSHDLRIFSQSLLHNPEVDKEAISHIVKHHVDMSMLLGQFIRDDKNNPLSLTNYLKVFSREFAGTAHDALDDAANLVALYKDCYTKKDVVFEEYLKVLARLRHLPEPIQHVIRQLAEDKDVTAAEFKQKVREAVE